MTPLWFQKGFVRLNCSKQPHMEISKTQIAKIYEAINEEFNNVVEDTTLHFEVELSNDLLFVAMVHVGADVSWSGDGFFEERTGNVEIRNAWVDDREMFGVYNEDADECLLTDEQRKEIENYINK